MRRQTAVGEALPAGSSRVMRLDPHSLPATFDACDARADGGIRHVEMSRERVVVRRAIAGIAMVLNLRIADYRGVALTGEAGGHAIVSLEHRDPSLSVTLTTAECVSDIAAAWRDWASALGLPRLVSNGSEVVAVAAALPAPRRRRRNAIHMRRPSFLRRRKTGFRPGDLSVHTGEREIIART